jgi:hypothetical protein
VETFDEIEPQADKFAQGTLIPPEVWQRYTSPDLGFEGILKIAKEPEIHPAIAAGHWQARLQRLPTLFKTAQAWRGAGWLGGMNSVRCLGIKAVAGGCGTPQCGDAKGASMPPSDRPSLTSVRLRAKLAADRKGGDPDQRGLSSAALMTFASIAASAPVSTDICSGMGSCSIPKAK